MEGKNYAKLVRLIFGKHSILSEEQELNQNQELADTVDQILEDLWEPFSLEYIAVDGFILEGKDEESFAEYIRNNAENLAKHYTYYVAKRLRRPEYTKRLRPYVKFRKID